MAHADQFAKRSFAEEAPSLTHGALRWRDPPEISVAHTHVHGDGALFVAHPASLRALPQPWRAAAAQEEALLELKLGADHIDELEVERALLRRQMRQVRRMETARSHQYPLPDQDGLWIVAPRLPDWLRKRRRIRIVAPGCYRIGHSWFRFLWIASNELPLRDELVPFLLSRTGRALDRFAVWVASRRPLEWVLEMIHCLKVSPKVREDLRRRFARSDDPEVSARQMETLDWLLSLFPEKKTELVDKAVKQGEKKGEKKGSRAEARKLLRRVLARRGLELDPAQDARIEACKDIATLERWIDAALTAASAAEALT